MNPIHRRRLEVIMAQLAAGDPAAVWALANEFNRELSSAAAARLREIGRSEVANDQAVMSGLVIDIALLLHGVAHVWNSEGGALPWVWARNAVNQLVSETVGHRSVSIDDEQSSGGRGLTDAPQNDPTEEVDLDVLADRRPIVRLLRTAIAEVGSTRDQRVHIAYRTQCGDGDPSPSHTVGAEFGLHPGNVRQIDRRMRKKLGALIDSDCSYAELEDLRWLA